LSNAPLEAWNDVLDNCIGPPSMVLAAWTIFRDSGLGFEQVGLTLVGLEVEAGFSEGAGGWLLEMLQGLALACELDGCMVLSIGWHAHVGICAEIPHTHN